MSSYGFRVLLFAILACVTAKLLAQPDFEEMRRLMMADWQNTTKYKPVVHTDKEKEYFQACAPRRLTYPTDSDDDYYPIDDMSAKAGVKIRCKKKELRCMTEYERNAYVGAFRSWNTAIADNKTGRTEQEVFVYNHRSDRAPPAHDGPAFLTWHDCFLELFEEALRKHNDSACPPYWDSSLDQCLKDPSWSVLWSEDLMGTQSGQVTKGLFANLEVRPVDCRQSASEPYIYRDVVTGTVGTYYLYSDSVVAGIYSRAPNNYSELCGRVYQENENTHGYGHMYIRGCMAPLSCSPCEPMFWCHHENVNRLFKNYIRDHPMDSNRTKYYPNWNTTEPSKQANATMKPFDEVYPGITCATRLNPEYDTWGQYNPPPRNCTKDSDCESDMLWCNPNCNGKQRCSAKLREGAPCSDYVLYPNACYKPKSCAGKNMTCTDLGAGKICTCAIKV